MLDATQPALLSAPHEWLEGLVRVVLRLAESARQGRALAEADRLFCDGLRHFAIPLLDSPDVGELERRIHEAVMSEELLELEFALVRATQKAGMSAHVTDEAVAEATAELFGDPQIAEDCARLLTARLKIFASLMEQASGDPFEGVTPKDIAFLLRDFRVPAAIRNAWYGTLASEVALMALAGQRLTGAPSVMDSWMRRALVTRFRDGSRAHLALMNTANGAAVSTELLPLELRLNEVELTREATERERYVLPPTIPVDPKSAGRVWADVFGSTPPPKGVELLFADSE